MKVFTAASIYCGRLSSLNLMAFCTSGVSAFSELRPACLHVEASTIASPSSLLLVCVCSKTASANDVEWTRLTFVLYILLAILDFTPFLNHVHCYKCNKIKHHDTNLLHANKHKLWSQVQKSSSSYCLIAWANKVQRQEDDKFHFLFMAGTL